MSSGMTVCTRGTSVKSTRQTSNPRRKPNAPPAKPLSCLRTGKRNTALSRFSTMARTMYSTKKLTRKQMMLMLACKIVWLT